MEKVSMLKKIRYIFDRKQKIQIVILGIMIFIGGFLETLGVGAMMPVVAALITPEILMDYIERYGFLKNICDALHIDSVGEVAIALLISLMIIYVIKNLFILFMTYKQNDFISQKCESRQYICCRRTDQDEQET